MLRYWSTLRYSSSGLVLLTTALSSSLNIRPPVPSFFSCVGVSVLREVHVIPRAVSLSKREVDAVGVITTSRGCFERCCSNKKTPPYHSNLSFVTLRTRRPTLLRAAAYRTASEASTRRCAAMRFGFFFSGRTPFLAHNKSRVRIPWGGARSARRSRRAVWVIAPSQSLR